MSLPRVRIVPYKMPSKSAVALQAWMSDNRPSEVRDTILRVRRDGKYQPRSTDMLINWGCNDLPPKFESVGMLLNSPSSVSNAANKATALATFKDSGVSTIESTDNAEVADAWLADGDLVVARRLLNASGGRGIELCDPAETDRVVKAPLYTKYIKKAAEYRAHVLPNGNVLLNQKRRRNDTPDDQVDWKIRNHDRGWIFARENVDPCPAAEALALQAIESLGLNFGAVDIIYNKKADTAYVLEVNTAPGLEGSLLEEYGRAFFEVMLQN